MSVNRSIKSVLEAAFGRGVLSRDGINCAVSCPSCGNERKDKKKLEVRLDDGRYHCWVCDLKGSDVRFLIKKYRPDLFDKVKTTRVRKTSNAELTEHEEKALEVPRNASFLGRSLRDPDMIATKKYLFRRGLTEKDIVRWRILSSPSGDFRRKAIIPSFDSEGNLNYYVARCIDDTGAFRYKNAKVPKEEVIFNEIDIDWSRTVTLVEGVFDAINCPENTVPILGSSLSRKSLLYKRIAVNQTPCVVALDPDLKSKAYKLASLLRGAGCSVRIAFAPDGKDLGDLDKSTAHNIISNSLPYSDVMKLTHKISEIQSGSIL